MPSAPAGRNQNPAGVALDGGHAISLRATVPLLEPCVVIVNVVVRGLFDPSAISLGGVKMQAARSGKPTHAYVTVPIYPPAGATVTCNTPVSPGLKVSVVASAVSEKAGAVTCSVTVPCAPRKFWLPA